MPLLIASIALIIAAFAVLVVALVVLIGWIRQDRAIRRMQRATAERAARSSGRGG
ncbi:hypothetical protein [Sphingomonas sp. Leaf37]|uniref:hypothetical protein n=1 Tax=Sphingomonas sp. Leaf37 TaxID=2876552 RepID=UPI001E393F7D|nr:hypothetical protein [Sphingomonas sp. Leaf37]